MSSSPARTAAFATPGVSAAFALAALLLAPLLQVAPAAAQDPGAAAGEARQDATHTVVRGETLSGIARARLGSAADWRVLHELNRDRIPDPNLLTPGTVLRLPAGAGTARGEVVAVPLQPQAGAALTGIRVTGDPDDPAGEIRWQAEPPPPGWGDTRGPPPADFEERRALLQRRAFEPRAAPEPDRSDRTIFYGFQARPVDQPIYSEVVLTPASELPVVQPGIARSAGWVVPPGEPVEAFGEIVAFASARALRIPEAAVLSGDEVRARIADGADVRPGDVLTLARPPRSVDRVGRILVPTGEVEVLTVEGRDALVRITTAYNKVQLGQLLVPAARPEIPVGVRPGPATRTLEAAITAFEDGKEIYLAGDRLFIDRGAADGLRIGDEFTVWARESEANADERVPPAAHFQVVRVGSRTATLRITRILQPREVRVGARLHLTAEMP